VANFPEGRGIGLGASIVFYPHNIGSGALTGTIREVFQGFSINSVRFGIKSGYDQI
jgi:hypothetical protein